MFIVLEGMDGSGKTTLAKRLADHYKGLGKKVYLTREPGGTEIAEHLRTYLTSNITEEKITPEAQVMIAFAARFQHINFIKKLLQDDFIVICDRYYASTLAYNVSLNELNAQWYTLFKQLAAECITPDFTFYLKVSVETSNSRIEYRKENLSFLDILPIKEKQKILNGYNWFFNVIPDSCFELDSENESIDMLFDKVIKLLPQ